MAVISGTKARPPAGSSWLGRILARKPRMLAAIALADSERVRATGPSGPRTARVRPLARTMAFAGSLWAMMTKDEKFRDGPQLAG
nr:hypothetical protein [Mangrovicoccus ximenensis]